jgi:hypothetical protein
MIHRSAASQPDRALRGIPRTRRALSTLSGLGVFLTVAIGFAPAASATHVPPGAPGVPPRPPPPPPAPAAAHFPLWAVIAIVAATVVLAVATTLVTLSLEQMRRVRRTPAAVAEPQAGAQVPSSTAEPESEQGEILASHRYAAGHDIHQADRR